MKPPVSELTIMGEKNLLVSSNSAALKKAPQSYIESACKYISVFKA